MTKLTPDEKCTACGGLLVPPALASGFSVPTGTDYVCLNCGRPYRWLGNPPKLTVLVAADRRDDAEDDDVE
jgi:DNA-directed RNA polymerase subunit RPC12/RpoP